MVEKMFDKLSIGDDKKECLIFWIRHGERAD